MTEKFTDRKMKFTASRLIECGSAYKPGRGVYAASSFDCLGATVSCLSFRRRSGQKSVPLPLPIFLSPNLSV